MKKKDYMAVVDRELKNLKDVIERKNNDYTGDTDSAFANFEVTSALGLSDARMGVLIRMVDKIQRVKTFIQKGELKVKGESAQDAARDIMGYSLILLGMLEGKAEAPQVVESKPLRLEAGKRYRRRDRLETRPLMKTAVMGAEFFDPCYGRDYNSDGTHSYGNTNLDLVEELP